MKVGLTFELRILFQLLFTLFRLQTRKFNHTKIKSSFIYVL